MRVLITGGAGFIGSHLAEYWQHRAEVRVLDNLRSGFKHNLEGIDCEFVEGSILDTELLRDSMTGADYVFHLAAQVSVVESMADPEECKRINTEGTRQVLEAAAAVGARKVVFSSSSAVYGNLPGLPKDETMPVQCLSPYAQSKLDGEYACLEYHEQGRVETVCLRYFNVFGPRQNPDSDYAAVIPIFVKRALAGADLTIYGEGDQTRDFVFVRDVAAANAWMAQSDQSGIFNVGNGTSITIRELAEQIVAAAGSQSRILHAPARAGEVKHSCGSNEKLRAAGWQPEYSLEEGLRLCLDYYRD